MKIGIVLPNIPVYSQTFFNYKIKGLKESGNEVIVLSNKKSKVKSFFRYKNAYPVYIDKKFRQTILFAWVLTLTMIKSPVRSGKLFALERKDGNSIYESLKSIYFNAHILPLKLDWLHFGFTTLALKRENVSKAIGAKMSVSFRGFDINIYPLKHPGCYDKVWENIDKVHSISDYLTAKARDLGMKPQTQAEVINPAIDSKLFKFKSNNSFSAEKIKFLTVGRLNWIKDYETAISTMKILKDKGINFTYNIIGTGQEKERLTFSIHQYGLERDIFFLGKREHEEVAAIMTESDIYLQTSMQEGFCGSVLEAQSSGMLCIVSDAGGLKENVLDGHTGWIVEKRNPEKLAEKILEVIAMTEREREEIRLNARKRVESDFDIERQKIKFNKFFN